VTRVCALVRLAMHRAATLASAAVVAALVAGSVPGFFGFATVRVMGASMGSTAPIGSIAVLRPVTAATTRVGDVILFGTSRGSVPTLHRVISIEPATDGPLVRTKGDANRFADPELRVLEGDGARLVATIPFAGYLLTFVQRPFVWIALLAFVGAGLLRQTKSTDEPRSSSVVAT
jgi:signal peptidase I